MPKTWELFSKQVLGYVAPINHINDLYVTTNMVQIWLDEGRSVEKIFLSWNAGSSAKKCSSGKNKYGVKYNSCEYVKKGLLTYSIINKAYANN